MVAAGAVALCSAILLAVLSVPGTADERERRALHALVDSHRPGGVLSRGGSAGGGSPTEDDRPDRSLRAVLVGLAARIAGRRRFAARLAVRLDRAGSSWRVEEWIVLCAGTVLGAVVVLGLLLGVLVGVLVGLPVGIMGPHVYLTFAIGRRQKQFGADLPDALQLVASGLASGYSLPQALDTVVQLGEGPVSVEVGRALARSRLGTPVEDALADAADRVGSNDFRWVVMAIRIQREVGGNLGEVLLQVAATIRERAWLKRHVAALAAEGKLSGYILGALPVVVGGYMAFVRPEYIGRLFTEPLGWLMLAGGLVMLTIGGFWMRSTVKVEL